MAKTRHRLSRHFVVEEFDCHNGAKVMKRDYNGLEYLARTYLEPLRQKYGACTVHSGYRTKAYNASVGGASDSMHIYTIHDGNDQAADVSFARGNPAAWRASAAAIRRRKRNGKGGLGYYPSQRFIHIDLRDYQANWSG